MNEKNEIQGDCEADVAEWLEANEAAPEQPEWTEEELEDFAAQCEACEDCGDDTMALHDGLCEDCLDQRDQCWEPVWPLPF